MYAALILKIISRKALLTFYFIPRFWTLHLTGWVQQDQRYGHEWKCFSFFFLEHFVCYCCYYDILGILNSGTSIGVLVNSIFHALLGFKLFTQSSIFLCLMPAQIDHPVLITECVCNPVQSRSKMGELLFETYGVPSIGTCALSTLQKKKSSVTAYKKS